MTIQVLFHCDGLYIIIIITIIIITIKIIIIIQVLFHWDGLYWFFVILFGISGGYTASLALMYCPRWLIVTIIANETICTINIIANIPKPSSTLYLLSSLNLEAKGAVTQVCWR